MTHESGHLELIQRFKTPRHRVRSALFMKPAADMRGLTLVELMVALTISLIIMAAMSQIFISSRATYVAEEGLSRVQEGGRFTLDMLAYEIRQAGFFGCGNLPPTSESPQIATNNVAAASAATTYDVAARAGIQGFHYTGTTGNNQAADWSPPLDVSGYFLPADNLRAGSDVLVVKYATSNGVKLTNAPTTGNLTIRAADASEFNVNDTLMATNCEKGEVFVATNITGGGATRTIEHDATRNISPALTIPYGNGNELLKFNAYAYYIGNTNRRDRFGNLIPALYRKALTGGNLQAEEMIENVEAMRIYYGVLSGGTGKVNDIPNRYVPANQVTDWSMVTSARVGIVVSTPEGTAPQTSENTAAPLNVLGVITDTAGPTNVDDFTPPNPNDGRSRRVFTFVVYKRQPPR